MATGLTFSELYEPIQPEELERARKLEGDGRHGRIFPFRHRVTQERCAVRFLSVEKLVASWMGSRNCTVTEPQRHAFSIMASAVSVLDRLRHPNLLGLADPVLYLDEDDATEGDANAGGVLKIVTEAGDELPTPGLATGRQEASEEEGESSQQLLDNRVEDARELFLHLAHGLHCLHANLYLHRGIRLSSVAQCRNRGAALQLSSFCAGQQDAALDIRVAPEVRNGQAWSAAADIWALGVCCYEYLTGGDLPLELTDNNLTQPLSETHEVFGEVPAAWELISSMLNPDPSQRPTITQVMNHSWLTQGGERARIPPNYEEVSLAKGREVSVLRLDRGKSELPLGLSLVAADLSELRDPDAALFVSSTQVQAQTAKDGAQTLLGAMSGLPANTTPNQTPVIVTQSFSKGPVSEPQEAEASAQTPSGAASCQPHQPQEAPQRPNEDTSRRPSSAPGSGSRCLRGVWIVPDAPSSPNRNEADHEAAVWNLHRSLLGAMEEATTNDGTVLMLPLSLYTTYARGGDGDRRFIAQELCSFALLLAGSVPARRLKKVVVVTKDVVELREMLTAFESLDGLCLSDAGVDLVTQGKEVLHLFHQQALDVRTDLELSTCVENLQLRENALSQPTATGLQVCLWCGLIGRRLSQLVLERGFQVTEVLSTMGRRYIAVLNHEKVDQFFESLYRNLVKVSNGSRWLGLVTLSDALQSLRCIRALLHVLLLPRVGVEPGRLFRHRSRRRRQAAVEGGEVDDNMGPEDDEDEECMSLDPALYDDCYSDRTVIERFGGCVTYDASRSSPTTWGYDGSSDDESFGDLTNSQEGSEEGEGHSQGVRDEVGDGSFEVVSGLDLLCGSWQEGSSLDPAQPATDGQRPRSWSEGVITTGSNRRLG